MRTLNLIVGLWSISQAIRATTSVQSISIQSVLVLLFVVMEAMQGVLLAFAPPPKVPLRQKANILAALGVLVCASLAGVNVVQSPLPNAFGVGLLLAGLLLALWATAHLGWRFGLFAEVRGICNTGPYRFLRHPMYVGYGLQYVGLALQTNHVQAWAFLAAAAVLQAIRAWQEERALKAYRSATKTGPHEKALEAS